jgi:hypothetical protein
MRNSFVGTAVRTAGERRARPASASIVAARGAPLRQAVRQVASAGVRALPAPAARAIRRRLFVENLRMLNDVLAASPLAGAYWISGGLLLGYARRADVLDEDLADADFGFLSEDRPRFFASVDAMCRAGFRPLWRWRAVDGRVREWVFDRPGARFEFIEHDLTPPWLRHKGFFSLPAQSPDLFECDLVLPWSPRVSVWFLDRWWRKPEDHERELTALYGRFDLPDEEFRSRSWCTGRDSPAIVARRPAPAALEAWDGSVETVDRCGSSPEA